MNAFSIFFLMKLLVSCYFDSWYHISSRMIRVAFIVDTRDPLSDMIKITRERRLNLEHIYYYNVYGLHTQVGLR